MTVVVQQEQAAQAPDWVRDLGSFRRWAKSDDFPPRGWYAHLNGELWADPSMETLEHNKLKIKVGFVLTALAEDADIGQFLGDRMLLTNAAAELSTEPDGMFVSHASIEQGTARLTRVGKSLEVEGSPEMVLEVVSPTSARKDTVILRELYFRAGIREYWIADPRTDDLTFDILKRGRKGCVSVRKHGGWVTSGVFGKSFRLTCKHGRNGFPVYALDAR